MEDETVTRLLRSMDCTIFDHLLIIADRFEELGEMYMARAYRWLSKMKRFPHIGYASTPTQRLTWFYTSDKTLMKNCCHYLPANIYPKPSSGPSFNLSDTYRNAALELAKGFEISVNTIYGHLYEVDEDPTDY